MSEFPVIDSRRKTESRIGEWLPLVIQVQILAQSAQTDGTAPTADNAPTEGACLCPPGAKRDSTVMLRHQEQSRLPLCLDRTATFPSFSKPASGAPVGTLDLLSMDAYNV